MLKLKMHLILLLFCLLAMLRSCKGNQAVLAVFTDFLDSDSGRVITEEEIQTFHMNYTLELASVAQNTNLWLTICVKAEDSDKATTLSDSKTFDLQTNSSGQFPFSVKGLFVGRTVILLTFVFSQDRVNLPCETSVGNYVSQTGNQFNLTDVYPTDKQTVVSHSIGYTVVVIREERTIDLMFRVVVVLLVSIVNLGMGCKMELPVVKETLKRPIAPLIGFCSQFILMPLISFAAVHAFQFEPALALGFFALGCSPGGSASNAYTLLLEGDVTLSVTMTFISTIAALGMVPLWIFTLGRLLYSHTSITVPYQNILYSLVGLIIAVGLGLLIKHKRPRWAAVMVTISKVLMVVFLLFVLTVGVYANLYIFRLMSLQVLLTAALLPYLGFMLGGLVAFVCRLPRQHVLTVAIETGIQNTGIAIVLLLLSLDHPESDISIVAPITSAIFTPIPLWVAIAVLHIRRRFCQSHKPLPPVAEDHDLGHYDMKEMVPTD